MATSVARVADVRVVERLVALETADVDVPPPPSVSVPPPLYFRVLSLPPASLRIELWELGTPEGARSVSAAGSTSLEARRIALAAGELARTFRERRLAELSAAAARAEGEREAAASRRGVPLYARLAWSAGAEAAKVSSGWFVGPRVEASLRFESGPRLALGAAWLLGSASENGADRAARFLEVPLSLSDAFSLSSATALDVGATASLASVRLAGRAAEPEVDSWSARAGAFVRFEATLSRSLTLAAGPDVSVLLHRVPGSFGGLFLAGSVGLAFSP